MTNTSGTTGRRIGLAIFGLLSLGDIATLALTDGETPPYAVAAVAALLGLVSLVLVVRRYRDPARPLRLLIGLRVLSAVTAAARVLRLRRAGRRAGGRGGVVVLTASGVLLTARGRAVAVA